MRSIGEAPRLHRPARLSKPNLGLAFVAGGKESDELAVGTPAGGEKRSCPQMSKQQVLRRVAGAIQMRFFVLVFLEEGGLDGGK